jgi:cytochrome c
MRDPIPSRDPSTRVLRAVGALSIAGGLALAFAAASPEPRRQQAQTPPSTQAGARPRVLVFSRTAGFRHDSIPEGISCIREILADGHEVDATEDPAVFTDESLRRYKAVVFLSTTGDILDDAQQEAFERFIRAGGGYAGVHAAADTEHSWPWYGRLVGAYFKTHPPVQESTVRVEDRTHRSTRMLPAEWRRTDEWYVYRTNPRGVVRVLASLDDDTVEGVDMGGDHPIMWSHEFDGGRSWYTGGGHTKESYREPLFRDHLRGGILWAAGAADQPSSSEGANDAGASAPAAGDGTAPKAGPVG